MKLWVLLYTVSVAICISTAILDNRKKLRSMLSEIDVLKNDNTVDVTFNNIHRGLMFDIIVSMIPFINMAVAINVVVSKLFKS